MESNGIQPTVEWLFSEGAPHLRFILHALSAGLANEAGSGPIIEVTSRPALGSRPTHLLPSRDWPSRYQLVLFSFLA